MKLNEIFLPYAENYKEYSCQENWYTTDKYKFKRIKMLKYFPWIKYYFVIKFIWNKFKIKLSCIHYYEMKVFQILSHNLWVTRYLVEHRWDFRLLRGLVALIFSHKDWLWCGKGFMKHLRKTSHQMQKSTELNLTSHHFKNLLHKLWNNHEQTKKKL